MLIVPLLTNSNSHTYLSNYIKQEFFLIFEMNIYIKKVLILLLWIIKKMSKKLFTLLLFL